MEEELINKAKEMYEKGIRKVKIITLEGIKENRRLGKTQYGEILLMNKGSQRRGTYLTNYDLTDIQEIKQKPINVQWEKSIRKAIKMLEISQLWPEMLNDLKIALNVGYDTLQEAYKISWKNREDVTYSMNQYLNTQEIHKLDPRLTYEAEEEQINGKNVSLIKRLCIKTSILWYMTNPLKIKKMNFGADNEHRLKKIAEAMREKKPIKEYGYTSYDVSFQYDPKLNKAWYSEEFKGCGNGHYYLALNETHALFYEDD